MNNQFVSKVFRWFGLGLLLTFAIAFYTSTNLNLLTIIFSNSGHLIIFILEIILAIWLSSRITTMKSSTAKILYLAYAALTGLTLSSIFIIYNLKSIIFIFLATSIIFIIFSLLGKNEKIDLTNYGTYLAIALLAVIVLEIINIFLMNNTLNIILCVIGIGIFVGYIAYDIRKILIYYEKDDNMACYGAFQLYLDFMNIFIRLLRLFGRDRD